MVKDVKPFRTLEEQVSILEERGLIIDDRSYALQCLSNLSYYRLSGYTLTVRKNDRFYENVQFSDVMQIYYFDLEVRAALLYVLESIEVSLRANICYYHAKLFGPLGYLDPNTFVDNKLYRLMEDDWKSAVEKFGNKEPFILHHKDVYAGRIPIWALVEILTLGSLSKWFRNLPVEVVREIRCNKYNNLPARYIGNWLHGCTILRNRCAHRGRLFNILLPFSVKLGNHEKQRLLRQGISINEISKQLFAYLIVIKKMVPDTRVWNVFLNYLCATIKKYPYVKLLHYGFPDDWYAILESV